MSDDSLDLLDDLLARAKARGADACDAMAVDSTSLSVSERLGRPERLERSEGGDVGLRVFVGRRSAVVATADRSPETLDGLVDQALAMARAVPEDPYGGLADPERLHSGPLPDLAICDTTEPTPEDLVDRARRCESAARAVEGVTNSEGAEAGWSRARIALANSNGFAHAYERSGASLSAAVIAGEGTGMETDWEATTATHLADLWSPEYVGQRAGERAVARLNPQKPGTKQVPVVFEPRVARSLLGHLSGAVNGASVARGSSFLQDHLGAMLFAPGVRVVDDPLRRRGPRSSPFDGEGVASQALDLIDDGRLTTWLLDSRSARQLGMATTGRARRSPGGQPSPGATNLYLGPGGATPEAIIGAIPDGVYVTTLFGQGVNPVTGDYSRGATGFWIENGRLTHPVTEMTIAGNLKDMFANLTPADDLELRWGTDAPTVRIDGMTVAGN